MVFAFKAINGNGAGSRTEVRDTFELALTLGAEALIAGHPIEAREVWSHAHQESLC